jgi:hypothetical protein
MRKLFLSIVLLMPLFLKAQDSIRNRIILIGDAGELDPQLSHVLSNATTRILKNKTTVIYLGDNVYPTGIGLPGSKEEETTKKILKGQFIPMRKAGAPVYFVPGNHDWDRMGPLGLAKEKREWEYINEQKDSLLRVVPRDGCPDPTEINISKDLVVIAFDSEWWLYLYNKDNPEADCDCHTDDEIINRFKELLYKNRNKTIILADHHPFETYGHHGDSYIWQDYLFPLTSINPKLYIPLPGIGILYPLLRGTFDNPEDDGHPLYKKMISMINGVFDADPNVIHVSGHDHGLQFNKHGERIQVVSGSGAEQAVVKKGKYSLYAKTIPGYVTVDHMLDNSTHFTYYANTADSTFTPVFRYVKPFVKITIPVEKSYDVIKGDSITVSAHPEYNKAGKLHRLVYGENYRKEWAAPAKLPVIKVSSYKGGLTPVSFGGAHFRNALLLKDAAGKAYILSTIEKYPIIKLPGSLSETFAKSWLSDAMSAQHPYAAVIAPVIANAVKVKHTDPTIGYVAADKNLGYYEKAFAGTICILEEREPGDSSVTTANMIKDLNKSNTNRLDTVEFFRTRLLDWFLGNWDENAEGLRWIAKYRGANKYYSAVPLDRAETFYLNQGLIPKIASRQFVARYLKGYNTSPKKIADFYFNDPELNSRFLIQLSYEQWMQITQKFVNALTDDVLEASLRKLPLEIYRIRHDELIAAMKKRRDNMLTASGIYYHYLNSRVDIKTTDASEFVTIKDTLKGSLIVQVSSKSQTSKRSTIFYKVFDPAVTKEVRVYPAKGNDSLVINNTASPIKIRIVGGDGHRVYNFIATSKKVDVFEKVNTANFIGNASALADKKLADDSANVSYTPTRLYNTYIPLLNAGYNVDDGYFADAGIKYLKQGFRLSPSSTYQFIAGHSTASEATRLTFIGELNRGDEKAEGEVQIHAYLPNNINFFGRGNETVYNKSYKFEDVYRARFDFLTADGSFRWQNIAATQSVRLGPSVQYYHYLGSEGHNDNSNPVNSYDSATVNRDKLHVGFVVTYIDEKRNNKTLPSWGAYVNIRLQAYGGFGAYTKSFAQLIPEAILYKSIDTRSNFVISERLGGGLTLGHAAFYQSMFLGGEGNLIGYRQNRFAGEQMMYNNLEARIKLSGFLPYILPGQCGITTAYDVGRVWDRSEPASSKWHNGVGAGVYFSPADMALFQIKGGYSREGWYPYVNLTLTF